MVAGLNMKCTIWQMNNAADDVVGGAVITGTPAYTGIRFRLSARRPSQLSLDQGLEVDRVVDAMLQGYGVTIQERDEIEVTCPSDHPYFGERFRVTGVQQDSMHPKRGHVELTLSRIERARSRQ